MKVKDENKVRKMCPTGVGDVGREGKAATEGEGVENGKTVVVGVRMDAQSRELLTWALVKVAEPGDRVVALHILPSGAAAAADCSDADGNPASSSSLVSLIKSFDSVLAVYEGFCNLKQIDLKLKICRGSCLRKILVREVKLLSATNLILGVTKNSCAIRSSTSIAKHCAKKLPRECSVMAVSNGKIVFQREASPPSAPCLQPQEHHKRSDRIQPTKFTNGIDVDSCPSPAPRGQGVNKDRPLGLPCEMDMSELCSGGDGHRLSTSEGSSKSNCSVCASVSEPDHGGSGSPGVQSKGEESMALVAAPTIENTASSKGIPEQRPGWPLLRRTVLHEKKTVAAKSKISVVQWAMRLPTRHSASATVHPDHKHSDSAVKVTANPDGDVGAVVPVETNPSPPPSAVSREEQGKFRKELESLHLKYSSTCRLFSYLELQNATSNFSADKLAGKGGSSRVYKGCLPDGKELAVKILKQSEDALREFVLEVEIITTLHHKNIVSLFGFCFENENLILAYDFLSRGSLEDNLHGNEDEKTSLGWTDRYKVAIGVAEALDYLHGAGNAQPVIHRDVKSSNILLSDDYEPQLSDFGLAKWVSSSSSHMTCSDVAGTFGYLAPEYFMYGKVNEKIDVFAFGVVLLELLTGRKPINTVCPKGQESLVIWAKPILQNGKVKQLLDPSLGDEFDADQVERMIIAASLCIRREPRLRPRMALVLQLLHGDEDIVKWAKLQISGSEDGLDEEDADPAASIQSHLNLALLDVEDDSSSISSTEHTVDYIMAHGSLEDYLQRRWSRSSSFD
uniref:Receptor-like cytosolic serine/threonine-protein kinase RBK2 n=1 Tax=Anthurium amnicola TaxID=1678845 RepID=A0A1D1XSR4_9ARAE